MPKQTLKISAVNPNSIALVSPNTYSFPSAITFDNLGRITYITTQTNFRSVNSISTASSRQTSITTSTGSITVSVFPAFGSIYTDTSVFLTGFTINAYSQLSNVTISFGQPYAGTYSSPKTLTITAGGVVSGISVSPPTPPTFINSTLAGLTVFQSQIETVYTPNASFSSTSTVYIDMNLGAISKYRLPSGGTFDIRIIGAPTDTNRATVCTAILDQTYLYSSVSTCSNTTSININGISSPLKWVDGRTPQNFIVPPSSGTGQEDVIHIYSFLLLYNGSSFSAYGSLTLYGNTYAYL